MSFFVASAQNIDIDILTKINVNRNSAFDPTFKLITNTAVPLSFATPVVMYSIGLIQKDSVIKQKALFIGETFLASAFVTIASKSIIKRKYCNRNSIGLWKSKISHTRIDLEK